MTITKQLTAAFVPALTAQAWVHEVVAHLSGASIPNAGLIGVDIGHVCLPSEGLFVSEPCAGFVLRGDAIEVTCMMFNSVEQSRYERIRQTVVGKYRPARKVHKALRSRRAQVNTLVSRNYTLAYSFDVEAPGPVCANSFEANLILHDVVRDQDPSILRRSIQGCIDSFTASNDNLRAVKLHAPSAQDLECILSKSA